MWLKKVFVALEIFLMKLYYYQDLSTTYLFTSLDMFHYFILIFRDKISHKENQLLLINTFSSEVPLFWRKINELFCLKIHWNWHMSFCITFLTRKFIKIFLLKMSYKNSWVNFDTFLVKMAHFFLRKKALRNESVK